MSKTIIVGGGLAGLSAAHTVLERGGSVLVLDKSAFLGGNSTKATSGINGALTQTQIERGVADSKKIFYEDTAKSAGTGLRPALVKELTYGSGPAVEWLQERFGLDLSLVAFMGAHSQPRTHRGKERFPGAAITMQLMEVFDDICEAEPARARLITKAHVTKLLQAPDGTVVGCEWADRDGVVTVEHGPVVLSTGGFGADFTDKSLLAEIEPEWNKLTAFDDVPTAAGRLMNLPTTNGEHCTGDGIKMAMALGGNTVDMEAVQVHPTGMIHPDDPDAKVRFLAAEALRGVGGILLNREGRRFTDELQKRDYVTGRMWNDGSGAFPLVLNSASSAEMNWHCKHYASRGLMRTAANGAALAKLLNVPEANLAETFELYNAAAQGGRDAQVEAKGHTPKQNFVNAHFSMDDHFHVAMVGPVVHYTMGGIEANERSEVVRADGSTVRGLYAAGEVMGGIHGKNRLGGNSLLDCVVFGRVSGAHAAAYQLSSLASGAPAAGASAAAGAGRGGGAGAPAGGVSITVDNGGVTSTITVMPGSNKIDLNIGWDGDGAAPVSVSTGGAAATAPASSAAPADDFYTDKAAPAAAPAAAAAPALQVYSLEEVAKHNTEDDCWCIIEHEGIFKVYDITKFLPDHPGGKRAPVLLAGGDATEEFMMLHKPEILTKYAKEYYIGTLAPQSKL